MSVTDSQLIQALAWALAALVSATGIVAWWAVRVIVSRLSVIDGNLSRFELKVSQDLDSFKLEVADALGEFRREVARELRGLDRRVTRVEAILRLPTPDDGNPGSYIGPERRAGD